MSIIIWKQRTKGQLHWYSCLSFSLRWHCSLHLLFTSISTIYIYKCIRSGPGLCSILFLCYRCRLRFDWGIPKSSLMCKSMEHLRICCFVVVMISADVTFLVPSEAKSSACKAWRGIKKREYLMFEFWLYYLKFHGRCHFMYAQQVCVDKEQFKRRFHQCESCYRINKVITLWEYLIYINRSQAGFCSFDFAPFVLIFTPQR